MNLIPILVIIGGFILSAWAGFAAIAIVVLYNMLED